MCFKAKAENKWEKSYFLSGSARTIYDTCDLMPGICILHFYQEERLRKRIERQSEQKKE